MTKRTYSALYDNETAAKAAITRLREAGVDEDDISMIARRDGDNVVTDADGDEIHETAKDVAGGAALGAGAGAILGIAALAIPGVGPFVAAGAIAQAAVGGAAATGAVAGAVAGGLAGALREHGIDQADAEYYERELKVGRVLVLVDVDEDDVNGSTYETVLRTAGGHSSRYARAA